MPPMWLAKLFAHKRGDYLPLSFYNTLTSSIERFELPEIASKVRMYNCGPTVYGRQHIGNLSMFVFTDILRRTLEMAGYEVKQVINFTDFGHLASDADEGEDKMMKGLKREGLSPTLDNMKAMGKKYADIFKADIAKLNVKTDSTTFPFASEYVDAQIALIATLEEKGYTYTTKRGVYFDTTRFPEYGKLGNINLSGQKEGARVAADADKRNPQDFILWKSSARTGWKSPWGKGFPGWHIECSAMINSILGKQIDIHTGGIEHIPIHHNNEIAQSEAATGKKPLSRFWMHRAHLQMEGGKMAKSKGNVLTLDDIAEKGFHPLSFRYLLLGSHYRTSANFTFEALDAAQTSFLKLRRFIDSEPLGTVSAYWLKQMQTRLGDDLDTAGVLALVWEMLRDKKLAPEDMKATILEIDAVLGLGLAERDDAAQSLLQKEYGTAVDEDDIDAAVQELLAARETARQEKKYEEADRLRTQIEEQGYEIKDTGEGPRLIRRG